MREIRKLAEPRSLTHHRNAAGCDFENLPKDVKSTLRESLVHEQRGICCYCLCRIGPGEAGIVPRMKIAHWHSRDLHPDEQLAYQNLLGACMGNQGRSPSEQHCDTRQGNKDIKWNPANPEHRIEARIRYLANGTIESNDEEFDQQINDVLNLNASFIRTNRKNVLDGFQRAIGRGPISRFRFERMLQDWNGESHAGSLEPYCQIAVFWLRKRLARI